MRRERTRTKRVAIACQGGGSHSAFTAGALERLLAEERERYEIVALSGTSGGAICALLVWYALLRDDRGEAVRLLESFWEGVSASSPTEQATNDLLVGATRTLGNVLTPMITPYLYPEWGREALEEALEGLVDFGEIGRLVTASSPKLLIGAVKVLSGSSRSSGTPRSRPRRYSPRAPCRCCFGPCGLGTMGSTGTACCRRTLP